MKAADNKVRYQPNFEYTYVKKKSERTYAKSLTVDISE